MESSAEELVGYRFAKSRGSYEQAASTQRYMAEALVKMLPAQAPGSVLEIGCGTGLLTRALLRVCSPSVLHLNDISSGFESGFRSLDHIPGLRCLCGDAEHYPWPCRYDWVVSSSVFQWFADFSAFVDRIVRYQNRDGVLAFGTFGPENMREIRAVEGVGLDYLSKDELQSSLERCYHTLECREEVLQLEFASPYQVLNHLRQTGVNALSRQVWTPSRLRRFEESYVRLFSKGDKVTLTYHPIFYVGRKKDDF
ncbi:MAG: malonyl-ACP O-methyltransferase BioC [Paludibacteraceae bacterium]|nr:malonyl-ACP O-methyltransferase BioC [Prevotellaceae bacterium]